VALLGHCDEGFESRDGQSHAFKVSTNAKSVLDVHHNSSLALAVDDTRPRDRWRS
jgi:hypothetical protein